MPHVYPFLDLATVNAPFMDEIRRAVDRVVTGGRYIGGEEVALLEDNLVRLARAPYAVAVSNGLDALRLILRAYIVTGRLHPGDEVIVPANTYIASVLAITDCRLIPVLVEPDAATLNIDSRLIEAAVTPRTRAIMTVHLYGRTAWDPLMADIARRHSLIVIEDNAQAIGAEATCDGLFNSRMTGALGHAGAFSFYPTKNIGAMGDAGAVVTHDRLLADTVRALANYGSDRRYHNIYAGFNCRLDPIQAAVLNVKLPHTADENAYRRTIAAAYQQSITHPEVTRPQWTPGNDHVWHQYVIATPRRDALRAYLADNGVQTDVHYATPPHMQPCYASLPHGPLPVTERLASQVISLPVTRCTSPADASAIADIINAFPS